MSIMEDVDYINEIPKGVSKNQDIVKDYRVLKLELWSYIEGLTRGSWSSKDKFRHFFNHLEDMIFGEKISIADLSKL